MDKISINIRKFSQQNIFDEQKWEHKNAELILSSVNWFVMQVWPNN